MPLILLGDSAFNPSAVTAINFNHNDDGAITATAHFLGDATPPIHYDGAAAKTLLNFVKNQSPVQPSNDELGSVADVSETEETEEEPAHGLSLSIQPRMLNKAWYYFKREDGREFFGLR